MKNIIYLIAAVVSLSSCTHTFHLNSLTHIPIYFDTIPAISRGDFTAKAELTFKKNVMVSKEQVKDYKQLALIPKNDFGTGGNASLGAMPILVNTSNNKTAKARRNQRRAAKGNIRAMARIAADPTYDKALFELVSANPNIDYWTNIRVQRIVQGRKSLALVLKKLLSKSSNSNQSVFIKNGVEVVTIKATGIDLLTDKELDNSK
jgi:hypothetical protein